MNHATTEVITKAAQESQNDWLGVAFIIALLTVAGVTYLLDRKYKDKQ